MRDQSKEKKRREALYEKYGELISYEAKDLPENQRAKLGGGLRCFGRVPVRDKETGMKIKGKRRRCRNPALKGTLFCKKCGGKNTRAMVHGRHATMAVYRGEYTHEFGGLLQAFMDDPKISDLRPELAHLRTIFLKYVSKLVNAKPKSPRKFVRFAKNVIDAEQFSDEEKYIAIKEAVEEQTTITDGRAIDRINRTIDTIGKTIERINKVQNRDEYILTPDGIKILLRAIVDIMEENVTDVDTIMNIREELLKTSTMTGGDLAKYEEKQQERTIDVKATEIPEVEVPDFNEFEDENTG